MSNSSLLGGLKASHTKHTIKSLYTHMKYIPKDGSFFSLFSGHNVLLADIRKDNDVEL